MTTIPSHLLALGDLSAKVHLLIAPRRLLCEIIIAVAARMALASVVRFVDAGNLFDAHAVARLVRRVTPCPEPANDPMKRICVSRAFTCYQVEALLARQIVSPAPLLVLDLLSTFADENAPLEHRSSLMDQILGHLERLAKAAPVLVGLTPADQPPLDQYQHWLANLTDSVLRYEPPTPPSQPPLF